MENFKDRIAIITGASSGIGRALAEELGRRGATVVVAGKNAERTNLVAVEIAGNGGRAIAAQVDVSRAEEVEGLVEKTVAEHGRLDYMFNNAGVGIAGDFAATSLEHWQHTLDVNFWGVLYGTQAAYAVMEKQRSGHIVNTASSAGLFPIPLGTAYTAGKCAVVGLSTSLRLEAASLGLKVSVVCPGAIRTSIFDNTTYLRGERIQSQVKEIRMMAPDTCARIILRGVARNEPIITVTPATYWGWRLYRLSPVLYDRIARMAAAAWRMPGNDD